MKTLQSILTSMTLVAGLSLAPALVAGSGLCGRQHVID